MFLWWRDVIKEAVHQGHHTKVQLGLRYGMILFITSEVMFFAAFFRLEEHTSELQSLMRISSADFCFQEKETILNSRHYMSDNKCQSRNQRHVLAYNKKC